MSKMTQTVLPLRYLTPSVFSMTTILKYAIIKGNMCPVAIKITANEKNKTKYEYYHKINE